MHAKPVLPLCGQYPQRPSPRIGQTGSALTFCALLVAMCRFPSLFQGGFGTVLLVRKNSDEKLYALKSISKRTMNTKEQAEQVVAECEPSKTQHTSTSCSNWQVITWVELSNRDAQSLARGSAHVCNTAWTCSQGKMHSSPCSARAAMGNLRGCTQIRRRRPCRP
eukprot:5204484-Pleurochrysis_carterae.AAC.2